MNHNEFIEEYENFTSSILNNVNINQFDISFLSNYILPQLQKGLCEKNYYKRFSSGDLSAHNILVNNNCEFKVVDCEFANMTHLFCEDWFRLFTFSSDKFKKITYVRDLISNLNPFYLPFLYLRQTILNLDIHASSAYNHFLSSDLFNSLVSLYKTSNIDVIHSSFLLSGFFNHSSNSDTQVFELKNKNIQLTDDVKDLFEKLSNLEHDYNNINQKLTDETQSHSDTKSESLIHQKNLDNEITAILILKIP